MKNIVVVSASKRSKSSSKLLAIEAINGMKENGNNVSLIDLNDLEFTFCKGCLACQKTGKCVINDDINKVIEEVNNADVLVFATPIYYYSISGQLKTFLDRMNPLYISKTRRFKEVYAIFTCADDNESAVEGPNKAIQGWIDCFDGVEFKKSFNGLAINCVDDLDEKIEEAAYRFGKEI